MVSTTSHVFETASPSNTESLGHPNADEASPAVTIPLPVASDLALNISPARGPSTIEIFNGSGSMGGQDRPVLDLGASKPGSEARSSADDPSGSNWEAGESEVQAGSTESALVTPGEGIEAPAPHLADVILNFLPFDRSTLDVAIDQLLDPFDELVSAMPELRGPIGLVSASLAVAVTVLTVEAAIRLRRSKDEGLDADAVEGLIPFPGLPRIPGGSRS